MLKSLYRAGVVSVGRRLAPYPELADALTAAVGVPCGVDNAGFVCYRSGKRAKTVSPDLYFAVAISGSVQHQAGMRLQSDHRYNKDADAPMFKLARYAIVGRFVQVIPAITQRFKAS